MVGHNFDFSWNLLKINGYGHIIKSLTVGGSIFKVDWTKLEFEFQNLQTFERIENSKNTFVDSFYLFWKFFKLAPRRC